jgi:hypothetical protein
MITDPIDKLKRFTPHCDLDLDGLLFAARRASDWSYGRRNLLIGVIVASQVAALLLLLLR